MTRLTAMERQQARREGRADLLGVLIRTAEAYAATNERVLATLLAELGRLPEDAAHRAALEGEVLFHEAGVKEARERIERLQRSRERAEGVRPMLRVIGA